MESLTKIKLNADAITQMVRRAFGSNTAITNCLELGGGWFNTAYSIDLDDGRGVVLKASPPEDVRTLRYEKNLMEAEVKALRLIQESGGVPVPVVYAYDTSREIADCQFFFQERVSGTTYNLVRELMSEEAQSAIEKQLGQYNAWLNQIEGRAFGYLSVPGSSRPTWRDTFIGMAEGVLQDGIDANVQLPEGLAYDSILQALYECSQPLLAVTKPQLVFWDLWEGNVLVNEGQITGIIDAERALWGDPLMEYYFGHFSKSTAFLEGYGVPAPSAEPNTHMRRLLYDLYLALVMRVECDYRNYDDDHKSWMDMNLIERFQALQVGRG
ncbi:phosphotransferase family protein [Paenibacillus sp. MMS18-CY102]|uniref:phosphotransferase family protein n=1 Tax=Paenibacillus sp. MMS18-CY102 TaxID=2682849 RepID=UPI00136558F4|nr:aminoglycoside phosphotransferase family protein [Paenibacillus sp. MMS18-CY102]MWC27938.1 phosphotransferase [Paenibacillus sp. MMS18-CY102]